ncbi:uncharacterized protein LOC121445815 [Microtus oregoni]|uniref:uncharacterized protein LOC121445815 n=1 Tax=Microtus oregoni TaxID=111838 RepID=UPI001BB26EC6|nr:uncharacterized protein LOC121445815 [Microtus oregoni]
MEQQDKVDAACGPSDLECNMGNETGAPLVVGPGLRGRASRRGRGHSCTTRIQAREHSEALPALGSEKRVHGALLKRRQIQPPRTTKAVAGKPLCQGKKSSAKARGHTFSPAPYMTTTLGPQLIALPSMVLHEAFALSNPCTDQTPLPCSSMEYHPPETQVPAEKFGLPNGPVTSDQASVSAPFECEEILQAAAALMTLKNSSWTWRQTHS